MKNIADTGMAMGESPAFKKNTMEIFVEYSVFPVKDENNNIIVHVWLLKEKVPDMKVVLMSEYAEEIVRKKDLILPGYNFIEKPIIPSILAHKLRKIFDAE